MAREVAIQVWCDVCLHGGEDGREYRKREGLEYVIPTRQGTTPRPRVLALCEADAGARLPQVMAWADQMGQAMPAEASPGAPGEPRTPERPGPCPVCGSTRPGSLKSLRAHLRGTHGLTPAQQAETYPDLAPAMANVRRATTERTCALCGETSAGGTGYASHLRIHHPELDVQTRRSIVAKAREEEASTKGSPEATGAA